MTNDDIQKLQEELTRLRAERDKVNSVLDQIGEAANIGAWEVDLETNNIYWSPKTHELHGTVFGKYDPSVENQLDYVVEEFRSLGVELFERLKNQGESYSFDYQIIRHDTREVRWVRATGRAQLQNGKILKAFGTFQDIHPEKTTELMKRQQDEKLQMLEALVNASPDIFGIASTKGEILFLNQTAYDYGWSEEKSFGDFFPIESIQLYMNQIFPVLKEKGHWRGEVAFKDVNTDELFPVRQHSFLLKKNGKTSAVATIATDLRAERKLEAEMERQRLQLVQASKMTSLGEMAGGMAHEINNPLAIIKGNVALLDIQCSDPHPDMDQLRRSLGIIDQTVDRIASIIKALRSFAKDGSRDPLTDLLVAPMIENTLVFFRNRIASAAVKLTVNIANSELVIHGRQTQLSQALANLVSNAFEAAKLSKTPEVTVEVIQTENSVIIKVCDSGDGVPEHLRDKILEPFFTTREVGQGTGLGLPVAKGLIEANNGRLYLDTSAHRTTFVMEFPRVS